MQRRLICRRQILHEPMFHKMCQEGIENEKK